MGVVFFQTTIVQYFTKKLRTPNNNLMKEKTLIGGKALFPPPLICKREFHFLCIAYCCILFYTGERATGESENSPPARSAALRAFDFCSQSRLLCKRISCASRAAETRRSRWRGARRGPAPAAKGTVCVRAREPGVPRACPCFGDVCRVGGAELQRARRCSLLPSGCCWLSHGLMTARLSLVFYYQTPNFTLVKFHSVLSKSFSVIYMEENKAACKTQGEDHQQ